MDHTIIVTDLKVVRELPSYVIHCSRNTENEPLLNNTTSSLARNYLTGSRNATELEMAS